jgi:hypothetical protein
MPALETAGFAAFPALETFPALEALATGFEG